MKKTLFVVAAIVFAAVSCQKEEFVAPVEGTTVLEVSLDNATKTGLSALNDGARKIYWLQGDKLSWSGNASEPLGEEYTAAAALTNATFTWKGILNRPCDILYPVSMYTDATHVTLPATQGDSKAEDAIATDVLPMYTHIGEDGNVSKLKCLTGLVKISWKLPAENADSHKMKIIEFKGNNNEQVSGKFGIDYADGTLTSASTSVTDKMVTVIANRTATSETPCCCLISVPAGTYEKGFTVTLVDQYGHYMEKSKTSEFIVEAGKVYNLATFDFVPTDTRMTVITTADEWNAYAAAYNGGEYTDAKIAADLDFKGVAPVSIIETYNNILSGNGFEFKNVTTNAALFSKIGEEGKLDRLVLGETYSFNKTEVNNNIAGLATSVSGTVSNCKYNGTFEWEYIENAPTKCIGGLVAELSNNGKLDGCEFNGEMKNVQVASERYYQYIGGVLGQVYNVEGCKIENCKFGGSIQIGDGSTSAGISSESVSDSETANYWRIGAVCGRLDSSNLLNCETSEESSIFVGGRFRRVAVAGLAADLRAEVSNCINRASITVKNEETEEGGYVYIGGISANSAASTQKGSLAPALNTVQNTGEISFDGEGLDVRLGGVAAITSAGGFASSGDTVNDGFLSVNGNIKKRLYVGGIFASDEFGTKNVRTGSYINNGEITVSEIADTLTVVGGYTGYLVKNDIRTFVDGDVTDPFELVKNTGAITVSSADKVPGISAVGIGGLVGWSQFNILANSLEPATIVNAGNVTFNAAGNIQSLTNFGLGGIVGYLYRGSNTPKRVEYALNSGYVKVNCTSGSGCFDMSVGGIVGYVYGAANEINNCSNTGRIDLSGTVNNTSRPAYVGGIVGRYVPASGENVKPGKIDGCNNTGRIYSHFENKQAEYSSLKRPFAGGIIGYASGNTTVGSKRSATDDHYSYQLRVYNCKSTGTVSGSDTNVYAWRGVAGGIAGYATYARLYNCKVTKAVSSGGQAKPIIGGVVGAMGAWVRIDDCEVETDIVGNTAATAGGILGFYIGSSQYNSIRNCKFSGSVSSKGSSGEANSGKAAAISTGNLYASGSYSGQGWGQISGCSVKGSVNGVAIVKLAATDADGNNVDKDIILSPLSEIRTGLVQNNVLWE